MHCLLVLFATHITFFFFALKQEITALYDTFLSSIDLFDVTTDEAIVKSSPLLLPWLALQNV